MENRTMDGRWVPLFLYFLHILNIPKLGTCSQSRQRVSVELGFLVILHLCRLVKRRGRPNVGIVVSYTIA